MAKVMLDTQQVKVLSEDHVLKSMVEVEVEQEVDGLVYVEVELLDGWKSYFGKRFSRERLVSAIQQRQMFMGLDI